MPCPRPRRLREQRPDRQHQNVDESLTAENIVSNDVTAIDAVTGDAANMAADVDYQRVGDDRSTTCWQSRHRPSRPAKRLPRGRRSRRRDHERRDERRLARRRNAPNRLGQADHLVRLEAQAPLRPCPSPAAIAASIACVARPRSPSAGRGNGRTPSPRVRRGRFPPAATPASVHCPIAGRLRSRPWG